MPPWAVKRQREESPESSVDQSPPRDLRKRQRISSTIRNLSPAFTDRWAKHDEPHSQTSPATLSEPSKDGDLNQALTDMYKWTRSDLPDELSLRYMERIVSLCQEEPSDTRNWRKVIAKYKTLGAGPDEVADLQQAREPFWTRSRIRQLASTIGDSSSLADAMRLVLDESENIHGPILDSVTRYQLMKVRTWGITFRSTERLHCIITAQACGLVSDRVDRSRVFRSLKRCTPLVRKSS